MTEDQISDFVEAVSAIGMFGYVFGDADLPEEHRKTDRRSALPDQRRLWGA